MRSEQLQSQLDGLVSTQHLMAVFNVTDMTIYLWRRHRGLPAIVIPGKGRNAVRYVMQDVVAWAEKNNIPMTIRTRERMAA